ncbi:MAG: sensor histidine kinase [Ancrocorticia sp.]|uniref:sensor histidine kinase n=1 Tax=Ancrocorticia sp. TaxID=2593684 RepID=UPI003F8E1059
MMKRRNKPELSALEQMRRYVLVPLYTMFPICILPISYHLLITEPVAVWSVPYLLALVAHMVACLMTLRSLALEEVEGQTAPKRLVPIIAVTTVAAAGLGVAVSLVVDTPIYFPFGTVILPLLFTAWALAPQISWQWAAAVSAGMGLVMVGLGRMSGTPESTDVLLSLRMLWFPAFLLTMIMMLTIRWSIVVTTSVRDQAQMDSMRADLAVAEERLRISRDMHDVLGRTLTAVAVKSALAAGLAGAGKVDEAAAESKAVHKLADDALRELRGVLAGYRKPEFATELAGAKGLLDSAGVTTRLVGDAGAIPPRAAEPFSWVLREAATNIVRHSQATRCTIRVERDSDRAVLSVTNNGAPNARSAASEAEALPAVAGSGLAGLRNRLEGINGSLTVERAGAAFTLTAAVSLRAGEGAGTVEGARTTERTEADA